MADNFGDTLKNYFSSDCIISGYTFWGVLRHTPQKALAHIKFFQRFYLFLYKFIKFIYGYCY